MDDETRRNQVAELRRLEHAFEKAERRLKQLIDARLPTSDELDVLRRAGVLEQLGPQNYFDTLPEALEAFNASAHSDR